MGDPLRPDRRPCASQVGGARLDGRSVLSSVFRRLPDSFSRLPAALLLIAGLLLGASLPAGALPAEGDFDIHVDWPTDFTTIPPTVACAYGGTVAGGQVIAPKVRVRFHQAPNMGNVWVTNLRIHEVAGHTEDVTTSGGMDVTGWRQQCGDPDPTSEPPPRMMYFNYDWVEYAGAHNGSYTITVSTSYLDIISEEIVPWWSHEITVDLQNLLITGTTPANPAPILWDPDTMTSVPLSVTASSACRGAQHVRVSIFDSEQQPVRTLQQDGVVVGPGPTTIAFQWDGAPDDPEGPPVVPCGIYLFKWEVWDGYLEGDRDEEKSPFLTVSTTSAEADILDVSVDPQDEVHYTFGITYTLTSSEGLPASSGRIDVFDPFVGEASGPMLSVPLSSQDLTPGQHQVPVTLDGELYAGRYTFLVCVADGHAARDKGHRNRYALQHNSASVTFPTVLYGFSFGALRGGTNNTVESIWKDTVRKGWYMNGQCVAVPSQTLMRETPPPLPLLRSRLGSTLAAKRTDQ
ncbi:MAG: hypothetical protein HY321_20645 [Armatimonadetes bacterium]|nr:hypothetical protein [Armatimonadota bacterium]